MPSPQDPSSSMLDGRETDRDDHPTGVRTDDGDSRWAARLTRDAMREQKRMVATGAQVLFEVTHSDDFQHMLLPVLIDRMWPGWQWHYAGAVDFRHDDGQSVYLTKKHGGGTAHAAIYLNYGITIGSPHKPRPNPAVAWTEYVPAGLRVRALADSLFVYRWHASSVERLIEAVRHPHLNRQNGNPETAAVTTYVIRDLLALRPVDTSST